MVSYGVGGGLGTNLSPLDRMSLVVLGIGQCIGKVDDTLVGLFLTYCRKYFGFVFVSVVVVVSFCA